MKIVLLGYMASGKSTVGRVLAEKMQIPFIDLDEYIEEKEGKTVSEIFENNGEIYFRKQEHVYLKELLEKQNKFILSLGGGTPCYAGNMDVLLSVNDVKSVYLKTNITTIVDRLTNEKSKRPLVARLNKDELSEFVAKHLFERSYFYNKATYKLIVDNKSIHETVEELEKLLS
ncbi:MULTISPECIES: shikimate kinase [Tenacibaculum]|uniref:Shikimate kinase n=2 Tax=Tenacibaculum TaxID=104267 RepID=A0ABN5T365_9FLAO|nr:MULTISPECIES: shikimate kinase [Tenacibaculum]GFD75074.1 shikimate kinase [Tenacibaculum sp. KUL113]GFD93001.1 shikimate kinase [Alteromonas sp. KUL154]GFE03462.1 shikimate kinase [Alteromonas sp. KUL156]AZJ31682.1 shikimate kinase [Tenacibaculum mesophilum]KAF9657789.1 shikimate kinase [Tenacibaculum mesophilum]